MTNSQTALHDLLYAGLGPDIFLAERAREVHKAVGASADAVNERGYGEFFSMVQNAAVGELTLAITKLFERTSTRYSIRSIPAVAALLRENAAELTVREPVAAVNDFTRISPAFSILSARSGATFTTDLAALLESTCPDPGRAGSCDLSRALDQLRTSRDKAVAHNEVFDRAAMQNAKWKDAEALLSYAKHVVAGVAMAYFGSAFADDVGYYIRSADAQVAAVQLRKLLKAADVAPAII
jgi:hypothetical protein